jgi:hypothetical protein
MVIISFKARFDLNMVRFYETLLWQSSVSQGIDFANRLSVDPNIDWRLALTH